MARRGLQRRITVGLFGYIALLSMAVLLHGYVINERAEALVWESLLQVEFNDFVERGRTDPDYRWADTETLTLYDGAGSLPPELRGLAPGVHDEVLVHGREHVLLVRIVDGRPLVLALDITDLERRELELGLSMLASAVVLALLLGLAAAWGAGRLVRPLRDMARRIGELSPESAGERIEVDEAASSELAVIADALNDYLHRNAQFVERERAFIDSASHELRTPIAVIAGATELAAAQPDLPAPARQHLARIRRTADEIERLIVLLLVLAKDPARLADASDRIALDQLLPEIVEDHRPIAQEKGLALALAPLPDCGIVAPMPVVQAAIGNLLRNAIENSDSGEIAIRLGPGAVVEIADPGRGMTPEQVSAIHTRMARAGTREGAGIGLDLIARLCAHLGWTLEIASQPGRGTTARLDLRPGQRDGA